MYPVGHHEARSRLYALAAFVAVGAVAACASVIGVDGFEIGDCKGGICGPDGGDLDGDLGDGEVDAGPDGPPFDAGPCKGGDAGPTLIRVGPADNSFCIDRTEVTFKDYRAFVEAGVATTGQPPECAWNTSFAPGANGGDDFPVANVDWCDALAYCKWAGKYLCGKVTGGKKVGPIPQDQIGDYNANQWLIACSAQKNKFPYGQTLDPTACNVGELDAGKTLPVGTLPKCEGGYRGTFDLVGNVWEWIDGPCRNAGLEVDGGDGGPASNECWVKGGGFPNSSVDGGPQIDCRVDGLGSRRDTKVNFIGIRCCSD